MMKSTDAVGITFANLVLGSGILNGVANVTLGAYEFNPDDKVEKVEPSPVIVVVPRHAHYATARGILRLAVGAGKGRAVTVVQLPHGAF